MDYDETFAPVARFTSTRTIIALASAMGWKLYQMDVKTTFLNGEIEKEVYIEQLKGFEVHGKEIHVCRLKKALYGLDQAPKAWYGWIDVFLVKLGFTKSDVDSNLYYKVVEGDTLILVLYVDDLFLLDTTPTLRGGVNQCVDTYTNFSYFSQQSFTSSSYRQH